MLTIKLVYFFNKVLNECFTYILFYNLRSDLIELVLYHNINIYKLFFNVIGIKSSHKIINIYKLQPIKVDIKVDR